jgi:hypothetical protein
MLQAGRRLQGEFVSLAVAMGPIGCISTELPETACCDDSANPYPCSLDVPCINNHVAHPAEVSFVPSSTTFATRVHQQLQLSTRDTNNPRRLIPNHSHHQQPLTQVKMRSAIILAAVAGVMASPPAAYNSQSHTFKGLNCRTRLTCKNRLPGSLLD